MSRDQRFYIADGNTTICVAGTLFKGSKPVVSLSRLSLPSLTFKLSQVHRSILAQDGSTFENMFFLSSAHARPPGPITNDEELVIEVGEGDSDEQPIHLHGDSVDQFRDLLWCLYALPHEISIMMSPLADIVKITNIARMAHKYHFANIEIWALDALARLLQREDPDPIETPSLILATEIAVLCDDAKLRQIICRKWKSFIEKNKDLSLAINVFERLGMRDLNGLAYHAMMLQGRKKWNSDPLLTREQRICLLSGYYEISEICANLPSNPPNFVHHPSCVHGACQNSWAVFWKDILTRISKATISTPDGEVVVLPNNDLIRKIKTSIRVFQVMLEDNSARTLWPQFKEVCFPLALEAITEMSRDFETRLTDFFQDVV